MNEKHRIASLDGLRGLAALSVAVPHFLMEFHIHERLAESLSIIGVEIFFVLSGFVLAPQIIDVIIVRPSLPNLGIFWARRWMRTIPAYLIALMIVTVMSRHLFTGDFLRYATYTQNLFRQSNADDYFPIAWSLSIEEWFYLTFPLFLGVVALLVPRHRAATGAFLFILLITAIRSMHGDDAWGSEVRRIVAFRMDAIGWGFLLNLVVTRTKLIQRISTIGAVSICFVAGFLAVFATMLLSYGANTLLEIGFPFYASAFGATAIVLALKIQAQGSAAEFSLFLGKVSYSIYLFHLPILLSVSRLAVPWFVLLIAYLAVTILIAWLVYTSVEVPILSARPQFRRSKPAIDLGSGVAVTDWSCRS